MLTPFDYISTNELLNHIHKYPVGAVLISSETQIDSGGYYQRPVSFP